MNISRKSIFYSLIFLGYFLILVYPVFRYDLFFRGNDLIANVGGFAYMSEIITKYRQIPHWNFYIGTGLPTLSDPLNSYFNPLIFILYTLFDFILATKILIGTLIFASGISFYFFCKKFRINSPMALLTSMTYMSSGYLVARLVAGHLEKLIAYALIPLLYYFIFSFIEDKKKNSISSLGVGFIFGLFLLSGSIYELLFGSIVLSFTYFYVLVKNMNNFKKIMTHAISVLLVFFLVAGWKLYPMMKYSQQLYKLSSPFEGSQNILSIIFSFFVFVGSKFNFGNIFVKSPYRWWESFAFIGPLPLFTAIYYFFYQKDKNRLYILSLIVILCTYAMMGSPVSPFHWLFKLAPFLWNFHVPSRIFVYILPLLLLIYALIFSQNKRKKIIAIVLMTVNLILVLFVFRKMYYSYNFLQLNPNYGLLLNALKKQDDSIYYVAQSSTFDYQLPLHIAVANHQKILNPTYGYIIGGSSYIKYHAIDELKSKQYDWIYPKYFIYPENITPPSYFKYKKIQQEGNAILYVNSQFTPYVAIVDASKKTIPLVDLNFHDSQIISIQSEKDSLRIIADITAAKKKLIVHEQMIKGWEIYVDGIKGKLDEKAQFLGVEAQIGKHTYLFKFKPF